MFIFKSGKTVAIAMVHDHVDRADGVEEAELMNGVGTSKITISIDIVHCCVQCAHAESETELSRQVVAQASSDETLISKNHSYRKPRRIHALYVNERKEKDERTDGDRQDKTRQTDRTGQIYIH